MKLERKCSNCQASLLLFPSRVKKANIFFCNKSCHRAFRNKQDNPSWNRDVSGTNNPMFGKHPVAWNKGLKGEKSVNWKGGLHRRKDGYYRININGERKLYHRHVLEEKGFPVEGKIVHHIDHNPSNNVPENLMVFDNQSEHVRYEGCNPIT